MSTTTCVHNSGQDSSQTPTSTVDAEKQASDASRAHSPMDFCSLFGLCSSSPHPSGARYSPVTPTDFDSSTEIPYTESTLTSSDVTPTSTRFFKPIIAPTEIYPVHPVFSTPYDASSPSKSSSSVITAVPVIYTASVPCAPSTADTTTCLTSYQELHPPNIVTPTTLPDYQTTFASRDTADPSSTVLSGFQPTAGTCDISSFFAPSTAFTPVLPENGCSAPVSQSYPQPVYPTVNSDNTEQYSVPLFFYDPQYVPVFENGLASAEVKQATPPPTTCEAIISLTVLSKFIQQNLTSSKEVSLAEAKASVDVINRYIANFEP